MRLSKVFVALVVAGALFVAPLCAFPWDTQVGGGKADTQYVSKNEADAEVYKAAQTVNSAKHVSDGKVDEFNATLKQYSDTRAWHPGLGIGGTVSLGGEIGADVLMSLRKDDIMGILSVGYGDLNGSIDAGKFDKDKLHVGLGAIYEF